MVLRYILALFIIYSCSWYELISQPVLEPLKSNLSLKDPDLKSNEDQNYNRSGSAASIPWFDDFSYPGPYPNQINWSDQDVYVNGTLGFNPVSIGVATFDGINSSGIPYEGGYGYSDTLTSESIDLVSANPTSTYITFYLQAGGLSFRPESEDSIILQFKDLFNRWFTINGWSPDQFPSRDSFYFIQEQIQSVFHAGGDFKFRFINKSDNEGMSDCWHLDYVKVAEEFGANPSRETDLAFVYSPDPFLLSYRSMPWHHFYNFEDSELRDTYAISLFNHNNVNMQADSGFYRISEPATGKAPIELETLLELPPLVPENQRDLSPGYHFFNNAIKTQDFKTRFHALFDDADEQLVFRKTYIFTQPQESLPGFRRNNLVSDITRFSNYFAYDDGSAESGIQFNYGGGTNPAIAIQFHTNVNDTLKGIQIMFPHLAESDDRQEFTFVVWGPDLFATPLYESKVMNPIFVSETLQTDSIQGITTFVLKSIETGRDTSIYIPKGIFHLGWKQVNVSERGLLVGFDLNSPFAEDKNYYFNGSSWSPLEEVSPFFNGAVIMRPIVTSGLELISTPSVDLSSEQNKLQVYPNPASTILNISHGGDWEGGSYILYDSFGKILLRGPVDSPILTGNLQSGLYTLLVSSADNKHQITKTIVLTN